MKNNQCRERWTTQTLDPASGNKATKWTPEEDAKLTKAVKKHGKDWVAVVKLVDPDRASNTVEEEPNDGKDEALESVPV
jgi:hypothetical protein